MSKARLFLAAVLASAAALAAACGSSGNIQDIDFQAASSGYFDEGVIDGENKIVPSFTFTLRNTGAEPVRSVQLNVHFRADGADGNMDEVLTRAVGSEALQPQQSTAPMAVRAKVGYKSQQPRAQMLTNSQFRDVRVTVFGRSGSGQWARMGEFVVERRILTR